MKTFQFPALSLLRLLLILCVSRSCFCANVTWKSADGTWDGPIGEKIAEAIAQGYAAGIKAYFAKFPVS